MAIPLPTLDDRKWSDLTAEGRALIPRYAPSWTDHNAHDPGVTLMELLAWRAEMSLFRLNHITPRHWRKYLALAGVAHVGPSAAASIVSFTDLAAGTSIDLKQGVQFDAARLDRRDAPFTTTREVHLERITLVSLLSQDAAGTIRDVTGEWRDGHGVAVMGIPPEPGAALLFGFDDLPPLKRVTLALWFAGPESGAAERSRILAEEAAQRAACMPVVSGVKCPDAPPIALPPVSLPPHHSAVIAWEVSTGAGTWTAVTGLADDTRSLTLDGIVEFIAPAPLAKMVSGADPTPRFYLRALLVKGGYDAPVILRGAKPNSVYVTQSAPLWQKLTIKAGTVPLGAIPPIGSHAAVSFTLNLAGEIDSLTFVAPGAPQFRVLAYAAPAGINPGSLTIELTPVGLGAGVPHQEMFLPQFPVLRESLRLYTISAGAWTQWTLRDDFDSSSPADRHFTLDAATGTITFGDGNRGRTAPVDHWIIASAAHTLAPDGNVRAGAINRLDPSIRNTALLAGISAVDVDQLRKKASNAFPAESGAAEPDLGAMILDAASRLHCHEQLTQLVWARGQETVDQIPLPEVMAIRAPGNAVDVSDIERIALETPGTRIARVRAWPNHHPLLPCLHAAGHVTVLVIPEMPVAKPTPTPGLLRAVRRYLDRRRIVCTQISVTGPVYVVITVAASVRIRIGANSTRVALAVRQAIDAFLDARTGGPRGLGWPFGRNIYRTEILQLIDQTPGVDHVVSLTLTAGSGKPQCGDLALCNTSLPAPGSHKIQIAGRND